jgi:hypothetical protein
LHFNHANVPFSLVVRKRHIGIGDKPQYVIFMLAHPIQKVPCFCLRCSTPFLLPLSWMYRIFFFSVREYPTVSLPHLALLILRQFSSSLNTVVVGFRQ